MSRTSNDSKLTEHYKLYCKILSAVIKVKNIHSNEIILKIKQEPLGIPINLKQVKK
jgi:hypothetical protein